MYAGLHCHRVWSNSLISASVRFRETRAGLRDVCCYGDPSWLPWRP
jgi:hypothetical protein